MVKGANQALLLVPLITYSLLHLVHMMVVLSLLAETGPLPSPCPSLDPPGTPPPAKSQHMACCQVAEGTQLSQCLPSPWGAVQVAEWFSWSQGYTMKRQKTASLNTSGSQVILCTNKIRPITIMLSALHSCRTLMSVQLLSL